MCVGVYPTSGPDDRTKEVLFLVGDLHVKILWVSAFLRPQPWEKVFNPRHLDKKGCGHPRGNPAEKWSGSYGSSVLNEVQDIRVCDERGLMEQCLLRSAHILVVNQTSAHEYPGCPNYRLDDITSNGVLEDTSYRCMSGDMHTSACVISNFSSKHPLLANTSLINSK